jgi:hypothetical protein
VVTGAVACYSLADDARHELRRDKEPTMTIRELSDVSSVAHAIQLAVAPVFLLTGIGALLGVMTNRLGRVIDRARLLEGRLTAAPTAEESALRTHLEVLSRRAKYINLAITLCTMTALLVCTVIAVLFLGAFIRFDITVPVSLLFIAAMALLVMGLVWFLREVFLATASLRIGPR